MDLTEPVKASPGALVALGGVSAVGYGFAVTGLRGWSGMADVSAFLALFGALFALYLASAWVIRRRVARGESGGRRWLVPILFFAAIFRLLLLFSGLPPSALLSAARTDLGSSEVTFQRFLLYDQDVWRYLWDGHVWSQGIDPYRYSPLQIEDLAIEGGEREGEIEAEILDEDFWQDIFENIAYQEYLSVYPPAAQLLFRILHGMAPGSVLALKFALAALDFGTCWLVVLLLRRLRRPPEWALLYAWNPLVVKEIAGSGHVDSLAVFFLTGAVYLVLHDRERVRTWALPALALATLSKLVPVILAGYFLRRVRPRSWWLFPGVVLIGYLPFLASWPSILESLRTYSREWVFNPGVWALVEWLGNGLYSGAGPGFARASWLLIFGAVWSWLGWKDWRTEGGDDASGRLVLFSFLTLAAFLLPSAAVMPWYLLWALPLAVVCGSRSWVALTALSLLSYLVYVDEIEHSWWLWVEHGAAWTILATDFIRWRRAGRI